jgi:transposase
LLATLWLGCERELTRCTPGVERILTPERQMSYSVDSWQAFLREQGYQPLRGGAFAKAHPNERHAS